MRLLIVIVIVIVIYCSLEKVKPSCNAPWFNAGLYITRLNEPTMPADNLELNRDF